MQSEESIGQKQPLSQHQEQSPSPNVDGQQTKTAHQQEQEIMMFEEQPPPVKNDSLPPAAQVNDPGVAAADATDGDSAGVNAEENTAAATTAAALAGKDDNDDMNNSSSAAAAAAASALPSPLPHLEDDNQAQSSSEQAEAEEKPTTTDEQNEAAQQQQEEEDEDEASAVEESQQQQQQPERQHQQELSQNNSNSAAHETEVTDEKLFLESTGFGEPKHRTPSDFEGKDEQPERRQLFQNGQETLESINIAVPTIAQQNSSYINQNNSQDQQQQQALPFFDKRQNSSSRRQQRTDSRQREYQFASSDPSFTVSAGFQHDGASREHNHLRKAGSNQREQSKTMTTLAPLNTKPNLPLSKKKIATPYQPQQRMPRYSSQSRLGQTVSGNQGLQPLPSLVKPNAMMNQSRSNSNFGKTFPMSGQPNNQQQSQLQQQQSSTMSSSNLTPNKVIARKILQQKVQIRQAYSRTNMTAFVEKGAFGGAMQEIFQDQVNAQIEAAQDASTIEGMEVSDKKARRKQRLNQILTAASKGRHTIKPSIEVEEIAHQYHNLKIDFNRVKDENSRMKTRLAKMSQQASKRDDKLISLNQELLALKMEQSQQYPMAAVEQHRFPDYHNGTDNSINAGGADGNNITLNPSGHPSLFQSRIGSSSKSPKAAGVMSTAAKGGDSAINSMAQLEKSALILSLKKQVNELRRLSEKRQEEIHDLQKSTKVCVYNELDVQLEAYTDECKRMRDKLEDSHRTQAQQAKQIRQLKRQLQQSEKSAAAQKQNDEEDAARVVPEQCSAEDASDDADQEENQEVLAESGAQVDQRDDDDGGADEDAEQNNNDGELDKKSRNEDEDSLQYALPDDDNNDPENDADQDGDAHPEKESLEEVDGDEKLDTLNDDKSQPGTSVLAKTASDCDNQIKSPIAKSKHEKSPLKPGAGGAKNTTPAATKQKSQQPSTTSLQKRFIALNDNVRVKNMQITELNRQLKAANETHQKQQRLLNKKNRELQTSLKAMEKQLQQSQGATNAPTDGGDDQQSQGGAASDQEHQSVAKQSKVVKPMVVKKIVRKKAPAKTPVVAKSSSSPYKAMTSKAPPKQKKDKEPAKASKAAAPTSVPLEEQKAAAEDAAATQNDQIESDHYSNQSFDSEKAGDQSDGLGGGGDVSTIKKNLSETGKERDHDDDQILNKSHGYTSIDDEEAMAVVGKDADENDAMDDEVEKQFNKSIASGSIAESGEAKQMIIEDEEPVTERKAASIIKDGSVSNKADDIVKSDQKQSEGYEDEFQDDDQQDVNEADGQKKDVTSQRQLEQDRASQAASNVDQSAKQSASVKGCANHEVSPQNNREDDVSDRATITDKKGVTEVSQGPSVDQVPQQDANDVEAKEPSVNARDSLANERSSRKQNQNQDAEDDGMNSETALQVNPPASSHHSSVNRSVRSEFKNVKMSSQERLDEVEADDADKQLQIQEDAKNSHLDEMRNDLSSCKKPSRADSNHLLASGLVKSLVVDSGQNNQESDSHKASQKNGGTAIHASSPTVDQVQDLQQNQSSQKAVSEKQDSAGQQQESQKASKDYANIGANADDDDSPKEQRSSTPVRKQSQNLLNTIDSEKKPLEGQSCGRNEDSEITSNQNDIESSQQEKQVSEEQMLDIAENILRELAEKLLENDWSVKDVFDHPKLVHVIPVYDKVENVVAISAQNFLGRMYQIGFQEITQLQVACMMRVLGKFDLDNAILFDDLLTLLENYGVTEARTSTINNQNNTSLDKSHNKSELPEATGSPRPDPQPNQSQEVAAQNEEIKEEEDALQLESSPEIQPQKADSIEASSHQNQQAEKMMQSQNQAENLAENFAEEEKKADPQSSDTRNSAAAAQSQQQQSPSGRTRKGSPEPLQRKTTRRDSILDRVRESVNQDCAFSKLREQIVAYSTNLETLMDIFKAKSYKQNIKSKSRQSETLVIQKQDFFELISSMLNQSSAQPLMSEQSADEQQNMNNQQRQQLEYTSKEMDEIEHCIQLTPKFPTMYAVRHIETLFQALLETTPAMNEQAMAAGADSMDEEGDLQDESDDNIAKDHNQPQSQNSQAAEAEGLTPVAEERVSSKNW